MVITEKNWDATRWPNFTPEELACKHCGNLEMDSDFLDDLQSLRNATGPLQISSGYRCKNHPAELVKGKTTGAHVQGKAVDIITTGELTYNIVRFAMVMGFTGYGISERDGNPRFIHLDKGTTLPRPAIWSY